MNRLIVAALAGALLCMSFAGAAFAQQSDESEAQKRFDDIGKKYMGSPANQEELVKILTAMAVDLESMISDFPKAEITRNAYQTLVGIYFKSERTDKAVDAARRIIKAYPGSEFADEMTLTIPILYSQTDNPKEAEEAMSNLDEAIKNENYKEEIPKVKYQVYKQLKNYAKAIDVVKLALSKTEDQDEMGSFYYILIELSGLAGDEAGGKAFIEAYAKACSPSEEDMNGIRSEFDEILAKTKAESLLVIGGKPFELNVKSVDGKEMSLAKLEGKVVLIDFWATWCGPCMDEMPNVINIYKDLNSKGFEIVGISLDVDLNKMKAKTSELKMTWAQFYDGKKWDNIIAKRYAVRSIPATFLLDKKGVIRFKDLRGAALKDAVEKLLKE